MTPDALFGLLATWPYGVMAVSLDQTIVFWDRTAREILGYTAERLVGAKCSEIPSGLGRSGLTAECVDCCACMRYPQSTEKMSVAVC